MKASIFFVAAVGAGAALCVAFAAQRNAIFNAHAENAKLRSAQAEASRLAAENAQMPTVRATEMEIEALQAANRDLPKLRNEVRQLRELKGEIEKLRLENQRLAAVSAAAQPRPKASLIAEGYVPSESWTYSGFGTPEATIQAWFLAIREGNRQRANEAYAPAIQEHVLNNQTEQQRAAEFKEAVRDLARMKVYQIATKEEIAEDRVVLGVRAAVNGEVMKIPLRRYGNEWKIDGDIR